MTLEERRQTNCALGDELAKAFKKISASLEKETDSLTQAKLAQALVSLQQSISSIGCSADSFL